jgi:pSer/pThr/pTyr-binding forkhead associated (FHA) protein
MYGFAQQCIAVGRAEANEVMLLDDRRSVSRRHAELQWDQGQCWIIDLNSKNATLLNERPIETGRRYVLRDGDRIGVGDYRIDLFLENPLR